MLTQSQYRVRVHEELSSLNFFFLSDVWLDHPQTLSGIQKMFDNCVENDFIPRVIVLCGNFTSRTIHGNSRDVARYQGQRYCGSSPIVDSNSLTENFDALADLIAAYPLIARSTHFVLVPGPLDLTINACLPRKPLLSSCVARLKARVPKIHLGTNPCRIKFFHQEIVIFREDLMSKMLRNTVSMKKDVTSEDLKRFVSQYGHRRIIYLLARYFSSSSQSWTKHT